MSWVSKNISPDIAEHVLTIRLRLNATSKDYGTFTKDLRSDIKTDYNQLEEQLAQTPEMICFYDMLYAEQKLKTATLSLAIDAERGTIVKRILMEAEKDGLKIRREDLNDIINADNDYTRLQAEFALETSKEEKLKALVFALKAKNDNLRSLAGFKREELKNS